MTKPWVLVAEGGNGQGRSALAAVRALAAAGYRPAVTVSGRLSMAAASRYCLRVVPVPRAGSPGFVPAIRAEEERARAAGDAYLTVLPSSDAALLAMGTPVEHLVDKVALAASAESAGLPAPPSRFFSSGAELAAAAKDLRYPVVVKPTVSRFPARRLEAPEDVRLLPDDTGPLLVQPFIAGELRAVGGVIWGGEIVAAVHQRYIRTWPPDCGGASAAETIAADEDLEERLIKLLDGYDGIFMAQMNGPYLLDVNPRVYGSLMLGVSAGVNLVGIYCDLLQGARVERVRARPGVFYRWLDGDVRNVARAVRARRITLRQAASALRPRRGAAHGPEAPDDPVPMLARIAHVASKAR